MSVLVWGIILFTIAFFLHLFFWRFQLPKKPIKALILLFIGVIFLGIIFLIRFKFYSFAQYLHICILFFSLFATYLLTYPAIEADSPSLVIILRIYSAGKEGLSIKALNESYTDDLLVEPRLKDLVEARLVDFNGTTYKINNKGVILMFPFMLYRNFLGLGKGG